MPVTVLNPDQEGEVDPLEAIDEHDDEASDEEAMGVTITDPEHPALEPAEEGLNTIIDAVVAPVVALEEDEDDDVDAPVKKSAQQVSEELIKRDLTPDDWQDKGMI